MNSSDTLSCPLCILQVFFYLTKQATAVHNVFPASIRSGDTATSTTQDLYEFTPHFQQVLPKQ
jgi:hypothetical protein